MNDIESRQVDNNGRETILVDTHFVLSDFCLFSLCFPSVRFLSENGVNGAFGSFAGGCFVED